MDPKPPPHDRFRHITLFYGGDETYLGETVPFIQEGLSAGEPVLVVETSRKRNMLRAALGPDADRVQFAEMEEVGANPARIIPAWEDFVTRSSAPGRAFRGIGEPIWAGRDPDELAECQRHESLLNVAFNGAGPWKLLCPYDTVSLDPAVIEEAGRSHEWTWRRGSIQPSPAYRGVESSGAPFNAPLPPSPDGAGRLSFDAANLRAVRAMVARNAIDAGLDSARVAQLVTAANEIATNSVRYGGGQGAVRVWSTAAKVVCEIRSQGLYDRPLVDRQQPAANPAASRGLWLANQLCDLVQIRSFGDETVVRLHVKRRSRQGLSVLPDVPAGAA